MSKRKLRLSLDSVSAVQVVIGSSYLCQAREGDDMIPFT